MPHRLRLLAVSAVLAGAAFLANACSLLEPEEESPRSPRRIALERGNDLEPDTADTDQPTPLARLTEEALLAVPPTGVSPTDPAPATAVATSAPTAGAGTEPAATPTAPPPIAAPDSESVLGLIGPTTAPQTAAALRLVEEGRDLLEHNQIDRAEDRFERAVAIDPANVQGYYFLAKAHYLAKRYDQAEGFLSRAIGLGARTDPVWQSRLFALQGSILEAASRYPEARQAYQHAVRLDPRSATAQAGLGRLNGQ